MGRELPIGKQDDEPHRNEFEQEFHEQGLGRNEEYIKQTHDQDDQWQDVSFQL